MIDENTNLQIIKSNEMIDEGSELRYKKENKKYSMSRRKALLTLGLTVSVMVVIGLIFSQARLVPEVDK